MENNNNKFSQKLIDFLKGEEGFVPKCEPVIEKPKDGSRFMIGHGHNVKPEEEQKY